MSDYKSRVIKYESKSGTKYRVDMLTKPQTANITIPANGASL